MHAAEFPLLSVGQFRLLAAQFPLGAGDGHALAGAHADEIGFELGEGGEDIEEQLSHRIARVVERPAEGQFHVSFPKPIGDGARIRDLPSKRLHVFEPRRVPKPLIRLTGNKIREDVIVRNWPDILRVAATLASGALPPSQLLRKFAAYPRQHELAVTLREIGRVERTLFIVDWLLDADMQRRANTGLNKGEAHHALKNALRIGRQGEIRDRSSEGQHYRMAGLNLLAAIVIYWNTAHLGEAVRQRKHADLTVEPELLAHISPLGWAHILLTGEYRWPKRR